MRRAALLIGCLLTAGCGGGSGADVDAARAVSRAVAGRFTPHIPVSDIHCDRGGGGWRCRFDTKSGHFACTLPRADAASVAVSCRKE